MPEIKVNGATLHYQKIGIGPETIVFAHGLLWSGRMFEEQVAYFKERYRCITFDFRGQGHSEVTTGGYDMDTLYEDAAALITELDAAPCHFVGLSMGGFIGMRLAARKPQLLKSLALLETSADPEPKENVGKYKTMAYIGRWLGLGLVADRVMPIMFGQKFMSDTNPARIALRDKQKQLMVGNNRKGITLATLGVVNRQGIYDEISSIKVPTLVMVGDQDVATVPAKAERIHKQIANSKLVIIPGGGHTSTVEEPTFVNEQLDLFLREQGQQEAGKEESQADL